MLLFLANSTILQSSMNRPHPGGYPPLLFVPLGPASHPEATAAAPEQRRRQRRASVPFRAPMRSTTVHSNINNCASLHSPRRLNTLTSSHHRRCFDVEVTSCASPVTFIRHFTYELASDDHRLPVPLSVVLLERLHNALQSSRALFNILAFEQFCRVFPQALNGLQCSDPSITIREAT